MEKKVIISIPAYNEEKTLGKVLDEINDAMSKTKYNYVVHVVDDGSRDKTSDVAKAHGARVFPNGRNLGLAETFRRELSHCIDNSADIIVHTDADGQYPASEIPKLLDKLSEGYDLVLGSRFKGEIEYMPVMKRFGNRAFAYVFTKMIGSKVTDTTTGFRAFTAEVAKDIRFINTFTYTQEQIIKAARMKFRIAEVPIKARKTRDSRLFGSSLEYAFRAWINILRIYRDFNPLFFFGSIGLAGMALGFLIDVSVVLLYLLNVINLDNHVPSLLLGMMFFLSGLQILLFGFLADRQ